MVARALEAATGAVTLIQRFGSAANLNIHLHALVLDGVYRTTGEGVTVFHPAPALTSEKVAALLDKIIARILRALTRQGHIDIERCPRRGGHLKIIAAIEAPGLIERVLTHLGLCAQPAPRTPARRVDLFQAR